jgi:FixJ family two-component response regulator
MLSDDSRVFVVDDDRALLRALERVLSANGYRVETFTSPTAFLARPPCDRVSCVLLDLLLPELSGLDVQDALSRNEVFTPIIFLSGYGDVPVTARAMRQGAIDFLVKPVDHTMLLDAVERALSRSRELLRRATIQRQTAERLARLTRRERQVCDLVVRGLLNKQIAYELGTSEKTVKVHRGRVMHKLEVDSVAALVRLMSNHTAPS